MAFLVDPYRFGTAPVDPNFGNVEILLHMDGTDTSTTFTDVTGRAWTANNQAQIDTAQSVFGGASMLCDGNGDFIQASASTDWELGTGTDITIEFWVRFNTVATRQIFMGANNASVYYFDFRRTGTPVMSVAFPGVGGAITGTTVMTTGVWYSVCACRAAGTLRLFVNGTIEAFVTNSGASATGGTFQIGCAPAIGGNSLGLNGWLDEFRLTVGTGRYTANYTPAVVPFPDS